MKKVHCLPKRRTKRKKVKTVKKLNNADIAYCQTINWKMRNYTPTTRTEPGVRIRHM